MNAKTLLYMARKQMNPEEIGIDESSGSDLFLKVTPISTALIEEYDWKCNVKKFIDNIDHELWYEIPFGNTDWWEKRGCPCGEVQSPKGGNYMIIEYDVVCFERTLTIKLPNEYKYLTEEILAMLDGYYDEWQNDDNPDMCLEEYMMDRLSETYAIWKEWESIPYGEDDDDLREETKMKKYRVVVAETQTYEVYVEAESKDKAEEIAFYGYGEIGEITGTNAEVIEIEEEN